MSLLQEARNNILHVQQVKTEAQAMAAANKFKQEEEAQIARGLRKEADDLFAGIHKDGMEIIQQYTEPLEVKTEILPKRLTKLWQMINPVAPEYEYGRYVHTKLKEKGQPTVGVVVEELLGRHGKQRLLVTVFPPSR